MRLEIIIPDSTRPDLKVRLTSLTKRLSAQPELVEKIPFNGDAEDAAIQKLFTPERLAIIDAAAADIDAGNGLTLEQLDARLAAKWGNMARGKLSLTVITSGQAASDLQKSYRYNAKKNGGAGAERWEAFLRTK